MISSLALLLLLIFLWIGKLYRDEIEKMQKDGIYTLSDITSSLDRSYFEEYIKPMRDQESRDSILIYIPELNNYVSKSEIDSILVAGSMKQYIDSVQGYQKEREKYWHDREELFEPLEDQYDYYGGYFWFSRGTNLIDSSYYDSMTVAVIQPRFAQDYKEEYKSANPIMYAMQHIGDTVDLSGLIVARLFVSVKENHYAFLVPNYRMVIFKRLLPQVVFSVIVFISTGLAFMLMILSVRRLREFSAMKNDFVSNMTHELKTPIATVAVALEALTNFNAMKDSVRSEEYIDISKKELNRLSILVDKVLKMTMFDEKEPELVMEPLNLRQLATDITASMKLLFEKASGNYALTFEGDNFNIIGDKVHITNVIYNLIENALKYTVETPMVRISVIEKKEAIILNVSDNGVGIETEFQNKIFDKFYRIPQPGDQHNVKGHGLGLAYVSKVLEKHNGSIALRSEKGKGASFLITIPKAA